MSDPRLTAIADRIRLLREIDRELLGFGAHVHRYQLLPALDSTELGAVEARLGVGLPFEYRTFVRTLGRSGAGPYYGLLELAIPAAADGSQPSPSRAFSGATFDGVLTLAEHGAGYRSLLVVAGPRRGEVCADFTCAQGSIVPEAPSFFTWYEQWLDRALLEWAERTAPRIALDGPEDPAELEAIAIVFEAVHAAAAQSPALRRTLGYLHLREHRFDDAAASFATAAEGGQEPQARLCLDRARLYIAKDDPMRAIAEANAGLGSAGLWFATRDELRAVLERALHAAGRPVEALRVLDERAAEQLFSFELHHRLARERLARNDLDGAGAALERAAQMGNILGRLAPLEDRVPLAFEPIIAELRAAGRSVDAEALVARVEMILGGN